MTCRLVVVGCSNFLPAMLYSFGQQSLAATGRLSSVPWMAAALVGLVAGNVADRSVGVLQQVARRVA